MSKKAHASLPADIRKIVDNEFSGPKLAARISSCWDPVDAQGKTLARKNGNQTQQSIEGGAESSRVLHVHLSDHPLNWLVDQYGPVGRRQPREPASAIPIRSTGWIQNAVIASAGRLTDSL